MCFFTNIRNNCSLKIKKLSNQINIYGIICQRKFERFIIPAALYFAPFQDKVSSVPIETLTNSEITCLTVHYLSFQFHNINSITISWTKKRIALTACFGIRKISYTSLESCWVNFLAKL